jgi:hypothetical protein
MRPRAVHLLAEWMRLRRRALVWVVAGERMQRDGDGLPPAVHERRLQRELRLGVRDDLHRRRHVRRDRDRSGAHRVHRLELLAQRGSERDRELLAELAVQRHLHGIALHRYLRRHVELHVDLRQLTADDRARLR